MSTVISKVGPGGVRPPGATPVSGLPSQWCPPHLFGYDPARQTLCIMGREWYAEFESEHRPNKDIFGKPQLEIRREGVRIAFENGWVLSAQWGRSSYGDNYGPVLRSMGGEANSADFNHNPERVEIACWRRVPGRQQELAVFSVEGDTIRAYVTADIVAKTLDWLEALEPGAEDMPNFRVPAFGSLPKADHDAQPEDIYKDGQ